MPKNNDLQMPEEIRCKRINLVQRNHDYDRQMYHLLNPNRAYLKNTSDGWIRTKPLKIQWPPRLICWKSGAEDNSLII